jgi:hypothetical protein
MQFNEAFGDINHELDKKAREINKKKKNLYNTVQQTNNSQDKETVKGIDAFANEPGFQFSPQSNFYDNHGNLKSDFTSGIPTPLDINYYDSDIDNNSSGDKFSLGGQNSEHFLSLSNYSDSDIISAYSESPKKKKKHIRFNTNHLKNYNDNEEEKILEHIKNCTECKNHLINLLRNDNHFIQTNNPIQKHTSNDDQYIIQKENTDNSIFEKINYKELKEIIILIIIGIIIIFVLDIFLRR